MIKTLACALCLPLLLTGCGGVFDSKIAAPQTYVLRLPPAGAPASEARFGTVLVQRPETSPGLESDRIALLRTDRRFDLYSASRWAAPAPDVVESVIVDALRATGSYAAIFDDSSPFAPRYDLRCTLRRFEADYTVGEGTAGGAGAPTVFVALDCTLGRHRDRALLGSFTAQGSARAAEDRLNSVVAAFETATATAVTEVTRATASAILDKDETARSGDAAKSSPAQ